MLSTAKHCIDKFGRDRNGGVAFVFAILLPVLMGGVGVGVDYATWLVRKQKLQNVADVAALAVVSDMQVAGFDRGRAQAVAEGQVRSLAADKLGQDPIAVATEPVYRKSAASSDDPLALVLANDSDQSPTGVKVTLSQRKRAIMTKFVTPYLTDIAVQATAEIVGTSRVCVLALDGRASDAVGLSDKSRISATGCSVYALSASASAIDARDSSLLSAMKSCAVGGYAGSSARYRPVPITGCPAIKDPLASRAAPSATGCDYNNLQLDNWSGTLKPGVYCGGLTLLAGSDVKLSPGVYVMKNGPLRVGADSWRSEGSSKLTIVPCVCYNSRISVQLKSAINCPSTQSYLPAAALSGDGVSFYFTGDMSPEADGVTRPIQFMPRSNVSLSAPTDGAQAGLLFFEDRAAAPNRVYEIMSDNARRLVGTIYLPRGTFLVASSQVVADQSEYTAIVANRLLLSEAPNLVINANYSASKVPVPQGIGPTSAYPALTN